MKKQNLLLTFIIVFNLPNIVFAQKMREKIEYNFNTQKLHEAKSVTWFGWDYSHLVINDPGHFDVKNVKTTIIPFWYNDLDSRDKGASVIKKKFKDKIFINDPITLQSLILKVPDEQFQNIFKGALTIDSVKNIVGNYNYSGNGIGVVGIANQMNKSNISVTGFVVVFDLETKELLYVMNAMGKAGDKGSFAKFYSKGIAEIMGLFYKTKIK